MNVLLDTVDLTHVNLSELSSINVLYGTGFTIDPKNWIIEMILG